MSPPLRPWFETEGPFGLPMTDRQADELEAVLKSLPRDGTYAFRRLAAPAGLSHLQSDERTDISWITVQEPDHAGDLVLAAGMDDRHFALNPIVTLNHRYDLFPVGRSLWRKTTIDAGRSGVRAKTFYPPRPASWEGAEWPPDMAFDLIRAGLLLGKSIGFLPLQVRSPTREEVNDFPQLKKVRTIIQNWLLLEYSCCFLPLQPLAVVEEIAPDHRAAMTQLQWLIDSEKFRKKLENSLRLTLQSAGRS